MHDPMWPTKTPLASNRGRPVSRIQRVLAVAPAEPVFGPEVFAPIECLGACLQGAREVARVHALQPTVDAAFPFDRATRELEPAPVEVGAPPVRPGHPDHCRRAVGQQPEPFFALAQRVFSAAPLDVDRQQRDDQRGLEEREGRPRDDPPPVLLPHGRLTKPDRAAGRQAALGDAPAAQLAPVEHGSGERQQRRLDRCRRLALQQAKRGFRTPLADFLDGQQRTADDAAAQLVAVEPEDRRAGHGVELAQCALLDLWRSFGVERQDRIEDDRTRRQLGAALQHLPEGELVVPAERQSIAELLKLAAQCGAPEVFEPRRSDHHADAGRVGQQRQSGFDDARRIVRDDDRRACSAAAHRC